jgi:hypothetical protein
MKKLIEKNVKNDSKNTNESLPENLEKSTEIITDISHIEEMKSELISEVEEVSKLTPENDITDITKNEAKISDNSQNTLVSKLTPEKVDAKIEAERVVESTILVNRIYRIGREIENKEKLLQRNYQTLQKWDFDDALRLQKITDRFENDKISKIIEMKEDGCLEGKNILIEFYQRQIDRLLTEMKTQEESGELGEFSPEFQEYLNDRTQRYEKQIYNLNKNYQQYAQEKREITIPKIIESIEKLKEDLVNAQIEAEEYKNK